MSEDGGFVPIVEVGLLPDGRMAARNRRDQSGISREELSEIPQALRVWWELMWQLHFPGEEPLIHL
jgi:hypothetical protein